MVEILEVCLGMFQVLFVVGTTTVRRLCRAYNTRTCLPSFLSTTPDPLEPYGDQSGIDMVEILEVCLGMGMFQMLFVVGSTTDSH